MDVLYRIPEGVASGSSTLASRPLLPDSNSLLSVSDIFARSARGSGGGEGKKDDEKDRCIMFLASPSSLAQFPQSLMI